MSALEFRPLKAEEISVRVGTCSDKGCSLLLYKDARCDMALLDEVVGPENWQCRYEVIDGKLFCSVGLRFDGEWVWKQDVGTPSNMEADKGEASDAFKRACFKWGIGRELYTAPFVWVGSEACNIKPGRNGKPQCYDKFAVTEMEVECGQIVKLTVANMSRRGRAVYGTMPAKQEPPDALKAAYARMGKAIEAWCAANGKGSPEDVARAKEGVTKRPEWAAQNKSVEYIESVAREFEEAANG